MKPGEIVAKFPGMTRWDLVWWEKVGYIKPEKVQKNRVKRREYSPQDLQIIGAIWKYTKSGLSAKDAYRLYIEEFRTQAIGPTTSLSEDLRTIIYKAARSVSEMNQEGIDTFIERVFDGNELSFMEMYNRAISLLKSPEYQEKLFQTLLSLLPIEQTPSGKYAYKARK